jgi:hypothetical protein
MRLLTDERKVTKFIQDGTPCPTLLIIEHYLKCKEDGAEIPTRVDEFITDFLSKIMESVNQGINPTFDNIFITESKKGRKSKRFITKLNETIRIGVMMEILMEGPKENQKNKGLTYEMALLKVADAFGISDDKVRKTFTEYNKL